MPKNPVIRIKTPLVTVDEMLAEVANPKDATIQQALESADLTLTEHLRSLLDRFPYRDELASPRAVWVRVTAISLERVRSARRMVDWIMGEVQKYEAEKAQAKEGGAR